MAHHARLTPWIPFYIETLIADKPNPSLYATSKTAGFSIPITDRLYLKDNYVEDIWQEIIESPLLPRKAYKYSDLGFYIAAKIVENVSGESLDSYVAKHFYRPMRLSTAGFNPLNRFKAGRIPPTEEDKYFRLQKVQGYVHDMGAAMLGGVSGHAGLFASAKDVAVIMQMLINEGNYAGRQYISAATVKEFTTRYKGSTRRGIGFDMKELHSKRSQNMSDLAPSSTFGHLGFTGICTWADPENDLVYVFLSNRTYPTMDNSKLYEMDFRPRIQTAIYEALLK